MLSLKIASTFKKDSNVFAVVAVVVVTVVAAAAASVAAAAVVVVVVAKLTNCHSSITQ